MREQEEEKTQIFRTLVTVQRTSFTVLMTYFFHHGKIHVILNTLQKLEENDYDAIGNANMVVNTLCETLGVTRNKLARILKHFVYDGYENFTF